MESNDDNYCPICILAPHTSPRIRAQSGTFTLHGSNIWPLDYYNVLSPDESSWRRIQQRLLSLDNLTPGDFASIVDQFNLLAKQANADELLAELDQSCEIKVGGGKFRIGFSV